MNPYEMPMNKPSLIPFDLAKEETPIIKVIGVGGGGSNAVNHMYRQGIIGVDFIVCNTDAKALAISPVPTRIQLGPGLTQGMGAGAIPEVGKQAVTENLDEFHNILGDNTRMAFITAGMGGGTGTGAAPIIAGLARELGILTVGIVTVPFAFEGRKRKLQAEAGIEEMKKNVDALIIICNDKLREIHGNLNLRVAFGHADDVLTVAARSIAEIITNTMHISTDFADIQTVLKDSGVAIMGAGTAEGDNRAVRAAEAALDSPLLNDSEITGARYILLNITSGNAEVTMDEVGEINDFIQAKAGQTADIIMGIGEDPNLGDKVGVTIIATGFMTGQEVQAQAKMPEKIVHKLEDNTPAPPVFTAPEPVVETRETVSSNEPVLIIRDEPAAELYDMTENEEELREITLVSAIESEVNEENAEEQAMMLEIELSSMEEEVVSPSIQMESVTATPVAEQEESPVVRHDLFSEVTASGKSDAGERQPMSAEEEMYQRSRERIMRLKEVNMRINSPNGLADMEREPAFKRKNIKLDNVPASSDSNVSRYTLSVDDNKPEIRPNNQFLHDRVD